MLAVAAFFLHTVVEEYKATVWKRMGTAIKSFLVGIFRKNKKMKVASSWEEIQARAQAQQRTDVAAFQGALQAIEELAKMFHKKFLMPAIAARANVPLLPAYIALIHALVAQWMTPYGEQLNLSDPRIPRAKKLFYYSIFIHRKRQRPPVVSPPAPLPAVSMTQATFWESAISRR